jgi:hypothetical protein
VGNSPDGRSSWEGTIENIGFFKNKLSEEELTANKCNPVAFYDFTRESRFRIANEVGNDKGLYVPRFFKMLKLNILSLPDINQIWSKDSIQDYIVNFVGFFPFGFLLAVLLYLKVRKKGTVIAIATALGGTFSLFIELVQVFIPTRCSELNDLFLNTLGSLIGALVILVVFKKRPLDS